MSKTGRINYRRGMRGRPKAERHISVRGVRRETPDLQKLSRAVIAIALRDAEIADASSAQTPTPPDDTPAGDSAPSEEDVDD